MVTEKAPYAFENFRFLVKIIIELKKKKEKQNTDASFQRTKFGRRFVLRKISGKFPNQSKFQTKEKKP